MVSLLATDAHLSFYYDAFKNLRKWIYQNPELNHTVQNLSKKVDLSPSYFQKLYKDIFGVACYTDVINAKITYAKALLSTSHYPIKTIASLCGYANDVHFMRLFKKITGTTPSIYRAKFYPTN